MARVMIVWDEGIESGSGSGSGSGLGEVFLLKGMCRIAPYIEVPFLHKHPYVKITVRV
jgi:hypothetical protein